MKNKKYLSGLITDVHLHAGENLFGLIFKNSLEFKDDYQVVFGRVVVDPFRPLDESDIEFLNQFKITGSYYFNEAGYLICEFEEVFWKFTGMVSPNNGNLLAFSAYDSRLSRHWSEVYEFDSDIL